MGKSQTFSADGFLAERLQCHLQELQSESAEGKQIFEEQRNVAQAKDATQHWRPAMSHAGKYSIPNLRNLNVTEQCTDFDVKQSNNIDIFLVFYSLQNFLSAFATSLCSAGFNVGCNRVMLKANLLSCKFIWARRSFDLFDQELCLCQSFQESRS